MLCLHKTEVKPLLQSPPVLVCPMVRNSFSMNHSSESSFFNQSINSLSNLINEFRNVDILLEILTSGELHFQSLIRLSNCSICNLMI